MILYAVDDERPALMLLKKAIQKALPDTEPLCFTDPSDLLEEAKRTPPDLVFLDIEMPEMTGLELAAKLNEIDAHIRIVFVTGFSRYAMDAFDVFASGYIMKPAKAEQIAKVVSKMHLPKEEKKDVTVTVFGNFDVKYKGKSVTFRSPKSKELLAYLVDRNGAFVTRAEMAGVLFEDDFSRSVQAQLSHIATKLSEDLEKAGIRDFFTNRNGYTVDLSAADCDLSAFLGGNTSLFHGEYMEQYSWAEYRKSDFFKSK